MFLYVFITTLSAEKLLALNLANSYGIWRDSRKMA